MAVELTALDATRISTVLADLGCVSCEAHVFESLPSTNAWLLAQPLNSLPQLCAVEVQTQGRGRRDKTWLSPERGVTFSIARRFNTGAAQLGGLSLVVGCAIADVLHEFGLRDVQLKWPNDVLIGGAKLCGILIESTTVGPDCIDTITGIGINYSSAPTGADVDRPATDLSRCLDHVPGRNELIARVAAGVLRYFADFEASGFVCARSNWESLDAFRGQEVSVHYGKNQTAQGIAHGVDDSGALQILTRDGVQVFHSGDVSLRPRT
ncbi:MAG: biotin--[acetyl-CoA-carboxylase] ligase [Pseudomonadota bacterium]